MSYMRMSGSLSGSRLATKDDFCASSQIAAMRPVLNSTQGPTLYMISEYPYPKYKTVYPIQMNHGETKTVTITFLSKDGNGFLARLTPIGGIVGTCSPVLKRLDLEVWAAELTLTANLPYGTNLQTCNAILTLTNAGLITEVAIEVSVIRVPPGPYVPPPPPPAMPVPTFTVPLSVSHGPTVSTPIHRSLGGSGYVPINRSQMYSPYVPPPAATLPSSVMYNSRYNNVNTQIPASPGRYHSDYVYNPALPVPQSYRNEINQSLLEASMRGSQFGGSQLGGSGVAPTGSYGVQTIPTFQAAPEGTTAPATYQPTVVPAIAPTQPVVQPSQQQLSMTTAAATIADPNAPVLKSPKGSEKSDVKDKPSNSQLNEKMLEPEDVEGAATAAEQQNATEDDDEIVGKASDSIQVFPQSIVFKPCEQNGHQLAYLQIRNTSKNKLNLKLQIANRSFATSTANCKYGQINPEISCFSFNEKGDRLEVEIDPEQDKTISLRFESKNFDYALNCAKVVIFGGPGNAYQVAILGINGQPNLVCLEQNLNDLSTLNALNTRQLRIRNDGEAPAFVGIEGSKAEPNLTIINPHGSEDVLIDSESKEVTLKYGNDYLRLLTEGAEGRGQWAEMTAQLGVDREALNLLLQDCSEVVRVNIETKEDQ